MFFSNNIFSNLFLISFIINKFITSQQFMDVDIGNAGGNQNDKTADFSMHPIFTAAGDGDLKRLQKELEISNGNLLNYQNSHGWTPLIYAVASNQLESTRLLITSGASLNLAENDGWTPLMFAASNGFIDIIELLLQAKADTLRVNNNGNTAFKMAQMRGHIEQANVIGIAYVEDSISAANVEPVVNLLLEGSININLQNAQGWAVLTVACRYGYYDVVEKLLTIQNIDIDLPENDGWTPLFFASYNNFPEVVHLLLDKGANYNHITKQGLTLSYILETRNLSNIQQLINDYVVALKIKKESSTNDKPATDSVGSKGIFGFF